MVTWCWGGVVVGGGDPPRQRRYIHDSLRPIRLTVALGLPIVASAGASACCMNTLLGNSCFYFFCAAHADVTLRLRVL